MPGSSAKWGHTDYQKIDTDTLAFTVSPKKKIPTLVLSPEDRHERMSSLLSIPTHRQGGTKFDYEQTSRTMVPLTQEDKGFEINLPLLNSLRKHSVIERPTEPTNPQPPKFYDDDQEKWHKKFA